MLLWGAKSDGANGYATLGGLETVLQVGHGNNGATKLMTVLGSGNVGIGTTTPAYALDVNGVGHFSAGIDFSGLALANNIGAYDAYALGQNQWIKYTARGGHHFIIDSDATGTPTDNFEIFKNGSHLPSNSVFRVQNDGLVGVGTAAPSAQLTNVSNSALWTNMGDSGGSGVTPDTAFVWNSISGGYAQTLSNTSAAVNGNGLQVRIAGNASTQRILTLGTGVVGNFANTDDVMVVRGDGRVGIGTNAPSEALEVNGNAKAVAFLYTSDRRLKTDIETVKDPIEKVLALNGVNFNWKKTNEKALGFIAQDVEKVLPEVVRTDEKSTYKSVQYANIVAVVIEAFKKFYHDVTARFEKTDRKIASVEEENKALKARVELQQKQLDELAARMKALESKK